MTQPFADALTWVPKSRALGAALMRAHDLARAQSHAAVGLEHMLLALIEDADAAALLLSCNIDLLSLNGAVSSYLLKQPSQDADMPAASPELQTMLIELYRRDPKHAEMCERLVDLDEGLQEWRYRHVKMVQRTIGALIGTGGSSGAQYLVTTLMTPLFPDLWAIRSQL